MEAIAELLRGALVDGSEAAELNNVEDAQLSAYRSWLVDSGYMGKMPDRLETRMSGYQQCRARLAESYDAGAILRRSPFLTQQVREDLYLLWPIMHQQFSCCVIGHSRSILLIDDVFTAAALLQRADGGATLSEATLDVVSVGYELIDQLLSHRNCRPKRLDRSELLLFLPQQLMESAQQDKAAERLETILNFF